MNDTIPSILPSKPPALLVVSGPSGVGKGTICQTILKTHPDVYLSISTTSRAPRMGEQNGVHYDFVTAPQFQALIEAGAFLEWAQYNGQYYGTRRDLVEAALAQQRSVILEIDPQGAFQIQAQMPEAVLVFIAPPNVEELERRLRFRGTETEDKIQQRLAIARQELTLQGRFDVIVVNRQVPRSASWLARLL